MGNDYGSIADARRFRWILENPKEAVAILSSTPPSKCRDEINRCIRESNFERVKRGAQARAFKLAQRTQRREQAKGKT